MSGVQSSAQPTDETKAVCRICGAEELDSFELREMMFGLRDRFRYLQCQSCGCMQIEKYLADIAKYYPDNYFSLL